MAESVAAAIVLPVRSARATARGWTVTRFVLRRAGYVLVVVFAVYTLAYLLLYALPSDPVAIMFERRSLGAGASTPEQLTALAQRYGLDQPLVVRYFTTLGRVATGDFGFSFQSGKPVLESLGAVTPSTLALAASALAIAVPASIALALVTSWRPDSALHRVLVNVPALVAAIPAFWLGLLLLQVFAFQLRWAPSAGSNVVLPAVALAIPVSASLTAVLVRALDDAQRAGYVELLRARGLPWWCVYFGHVVRNSLLPFVTLAGLTIAGVLAGTVIIETVFARAGVGRLLVTSVETQDAPVVLAITMIAAIVFATTNFAVDLLYPVLDPRLRHASQGATS